MMEAWGKGMTEADSGFGTGWRSCRIVGTYYVVAHIENTASTPPSQGTELYQALPQNSPVLDLDPKYSYREGLEIDIQEIGSREGD